MSVLGEPAALEAALSWYRAAGTLTGPFRFAVLPGIGRFVTDEAPEAVTRLLLSHLDAQR